LDPPVKRIIYSLMGIVFTIEEGCLSTFIGNFPNPKCLAGTLGTNAPPHGKRGWVFDIKLYILYSVELLSCAGPGS
jgi:hypothetical protein